MHTDDMVEHIDVIPKARRLFEITQLLHRKPHSVRQIVQTLYPSAPITLASRIYNNLRRAIQYDLRDLSESYTEGLEIRTGKPPLYSLKTPPKAQMDFVEALTLHAAGRLVYHRATGEQQRHLRFLKKLTQDLPEHVQTMVERSIGDVGKRYSRETLNIERVAEAWFNLYPLVFEYKKPNGSGKPRTNVVEIYMVEVDPQNLDLYIVGKETSFHHDIRTFKVARMERPQVRREESYTIPEDFDPQAYFRSAWGVVGAYDQPPETLVLRFRADVAYRIKEGGYAHIRRIEDLPDGRLEVTVSAPLDSSGLPREVLPWIYGFGSRVEIVSPEYVRQHWLNEIAEITRSYAQPASEDTASIQ